MGFLKDLLTLDVLTVTGSINVDRKAKSDSEGFGSTDEGFIFDFDRLIKRQDGKVTLNSSLRVVAASHIALDHDTLHFVADDLTAAEQELVKLHIDAVSSASEARAAVIARISPFRNPRLITDDTPTPKQ